MSAVQEPPVDKSHQLAAEILGLLNDAHDREDAILQSVPLLDSPDDIVDIRLEAVSRKTWRVECACDAALVATINFQLGGIGTRKALKEKAKSARSDVSTIYRNAQVYTTFLGQNTPKRSLNVQTVLNEKGFYEAALRTDKPHEAIRILAKEKEANPEYSVRDALRQLKGLRAPRGVPDLGAEAGDYLDPHYKSFLAEIEISLLAFRNRSPRKEFTVRLDSWLRQVRYEKGRTPTSDYKAVRDQVDQGATSVDEIGEEVYLSPAEIKAICTLIIEKEPEVYEWRKTGAAPQLDNNHGPAALGIFRVDAPHYERSNGPTAADYAAGKKDDEDDEEHF
jgi:hypothetical protein